MDCKIETNDRQCVFGVIPSRKIDKRNEDTGITVVVTDRVSFTSYKQRI